MLNNAKKWLKKAAHDIAAHYKKITFYTFLVNTTIFFAVFGLMLVIDLATKYSIYNKNDATLAVDYGRLWGLRHVLNPGTTFFGSSLSYGFLHFLSIVIVLLSYGITVSITNKRNLAIIIGLASISAGAVGNMADRINYDGVRDIFIVPWASHGVFNWADLSLVCGAIFTSLYVVISNIVFWVLDSKKHQNQNQSAHTSAQHQQLK
ncbi:signal peptidase II [Mycoplasma sp. 128]|uniref:signal peptidase II n=1 Tax=Mycoplasma sp. 3341 TaxID=3447506 RepID=UPI003F65ED37